MSRILFHVMSEWKAKLPFRLVRHGTNLHYENSLLKRENLPHSMIETALFFLLIFNVLIVRSSARASRNVTVEFSLDSRIPRTPSS